MVGYFITFALIMLTSCISYFCNVGCFKNVKHWGVSTGTMYWPPVSFPPYEFSSRSVPASFPGKIFLIWKIYYLANLTPVFPSFCLTWRIELLASGCQPSPLTLAQDWHPPCLPHRRYSEFPLFNWNTLQPCWTPGTAVSRLQTAVVYNAGISLQLFQLLNKNCCWTPLLSYSTEFPKPLSTDPAALQDFVLLPGKAVNIADSPQLPPSLSIT